MVRGKKEENLLSAVVIHCERLPEQARSMSRQKIRNSARQETKDGDPEAKRWFRDEEDGMVNGLV